MAVRFGILGVVAIWRDDGVLVDVGHPRQQRVLAALLVDGVVPADVLVDRVWGENAPGRSRGSLYGYVSRLRQVLSGVGVDVVRDQGGYRLGVGAGSLDVHRFRELADQARAVPDEEDAASLWEEALGLWRGQAFAGMDTPWFNEQRDFLDRERLAAQLDLADIRLRMGQHDRILAGLFARAEAYPLDERVAGQLVLALYRAGRSADALERFHQIRQHLADELGIDPGPDLRALHQRILSSDPALDLPVDQPAPPSAAKPAHTPVPSPRQLPAQPNQFVGRGNELARLTQAVTDGGLVVLSGIGGIGKTWLALRWAHDNVARFPDGQLYLNLRGFEPHQEPLSPHGAIRILLDSLGVASDAVPDTSQAQTRLYRSLVADRRLLILLDNARDADQVRPLLPGSATCAVLITSRDQMPEMVAADGALPIMPTALGVDEARALLTRRLGRRRTAAEPEAMSGIVTACAGLPLALAIVAARAATHPEFSLAMLADELRQSQGGLDAFGLGGTVLGLRSVFSVSHRRLSADAARLFRLLSVHPGPEVSRPAAVSLTGETASRTHTALGELTRAQLVTEHRPGRYTFHDLIRAYAFELAEDAAYDGERDAALRRLISHYMHTAKVAVGLLDEHRSGIDLVPVEPGVVPESMADASEALRWLTAEHPVLLTVIGTATRAGLDIHTWQLTWTLSHFHAVHGHLHEWLSSTTIGLRAAERVGDVLGQALSHRALARVETRLGGYADAEAHGIRALALFRELGDAGGQARTHLSLGWLHDQQNRHREALDHVEQALALFRASGNTVGEARALNAGAWTRTRLGDHERAVDQCRQALAILQSIGDRTGEAATWDTLGSAYQWRGGHAEAADCYRQAIGLYQEIGDRYWEAETLTRLGETSKAAGDTGAALRAWGDALAILDTVGHPKADQLRDRLIAVLAHSDPANRLADSAG